MIGWILFAEFFKIGLFCFGGAFGMLPLIEETVVAHGWMTQAQFYDFVGVCESTPGPIAVNVATYVGSTQAGVWGSLCATLGVILPSFLIILLIASVLRNVTGNRWFRGFLQGVQPVIVGMILSTGLLLLARAFGLTGGDERGGPISLLLFGGIAALYFLMTKVFHRKVTALPLILLSAGLGIVAGVLG